MADRYEDELAERRANGGRPKTPLEAAETAVSAGPGVGALPLQWDETADEADEADEVGEEREAATTIDLTERAGRDDFQVWSDVLRRRPTHAARITAHPSAAGERPAPPRPRDDDDDDDFARTLMDRRRRRGRRRPGGADPEQPSGGGAVPEDSTPPVNVSRLRPEPQERQGGPSGFGADLGARVVTGVIVAVVCLLTFNAGAGPTAWLVAGLVGLGVIELCAALRSQGYRPAVVVALVGSVSLVLGAYVSGQSAYPLVMSLVVLATLVWHLAQIVPGPPATGVAMTLLAFGYVGVLGGFGGLVLAFDNGVGMLLGTALCTAAYDVVGYFAGRRFGRRRLTAISPNKTVEGLLAGMGASVVAGVVLAGAISPWDRPSGLALGLVIALVAPVGDLCESMLKRDLGVKDLGGLLPGHGGVLDRFDTVLFVLPAAYYLVRLLDLN